MVLVVNGRERNPSALEQTILMKLSIRMGAWQYFHVSFVQNSLQVDHRGAPQDVD